MQNSGYILLFMLECGNNCIQLRIDFFFFALLTCFLKLPESIYFKIITAEQHPKNTTSEKKTYDLMTATEYK